MIIWLKPESTHSSAAYWMSGLSTSGSISFGCAFVAGRNRVPRPAAGNTAFRTILFTSLLFLARGGLARGLPRLGLGGLGLGRLGLAGLGFGRLRLGGLSVGPGGRRVFLA